MTALRENGGQAILSNPLVTLLFSVFFVATTIMGAGACATPPPPTAITVALLVDATDSVAAPMPGAKTRREAYLDATRYIIRQLPSGSTLVLGRTCGVSEELWNAPVTRKDFPKLTLVIESSLNSCNGRPAGTDLVGGLKWLERRSGAMTLIYVTDGLHTIAQPAATAKEEFLKALDRLPKPVRGRFWMLGLDESVRDQIARRVAHASGLHDLENVVEQLGSSIRKGGN